MRSYPGSEQNYSFSNALLKGVIGGMDLNIFNKPLKLTKTFLFFKPLLLLARMNVNNEQKTIFYNIRFYIVDIYS